MKFGVVVFPGSNCDADTIHVLNQVYGQEVVKLWHKDNDLQGCDFVIIPGGFSYGDYLRSGAIAQFSPIMEKVNQFVSEGGFVFGICNGFQVLCEANLLPGALLRNEKQLFQCKNVHIKVSSSNSLISSALKQDEVLQLPIAHAEGRYYAPESTLADLNAHNQIIFRYCDALGNVSDHSNANGSSENIAGICNLQRNVFGMMPHPERAAESVLGNTDGKGIFDSILQQVSVL